MAGVQKRKMWTKPNLLSDLIRRILWAKNDQKKGEQKMKSMTNKNLYKSLPVIFAGAILMLVAQGVLAGQTFTVTNTNDDGPGSLRQAIESANSDAGVDVIAFNIPAWGRQPGTGKHTIQPLTPLPHITDPVIIDGYTQPGAAPATDDTPATLLIELDGINVIGLHWDSGLNIDAGNSTVRGLVINRFGDVGIHIQDQGRNIIEGNYIGTDVTGTMNRGNFQGGVRIWDAPNNTIGGTTPEARNVISGNNGYAVGILLPGATANKVQGNFIGTDVTGTADLGNSNHGVFIYEAASSNTIGPGNVIVGNGGAGIGIHGIGTTGNHILGNFIGIARNGTKPLGNFDHGVIIEEEASDNTIGPGNTISNNHYGIRLRSSSDNQIYNNNFIDNTIQAYVTGRGSNIFNLEKPIGGNYWSDWTNPDADGDGFVDDPYVFTSGVDYLPWARQDGWLHTPKVYYVDTVYGDDDNGGLAPEAAFATIQKGINMAEEGDVVLVYPGLYQEEINFLGKTLTVQGVAASPAGVPVLQNPGDFAVSFYYGEGPDSILKNFIIRHSFMGIFIAGSFPTISNLTIVDNKYGIEAYVGSEPDISNTILWNNTDGDLFQCQARYSCIERGGEGEGNIDADPLFVDTDSGDYHLRSERGRYWPEYDIWVLDKVTSPCVDAGDPKAEALNEPMPNGSRINIGAYGGTTEASLSPSEQPCPLSDKAFNPYPADGAIDVDRDVALNWTPGLNAVSHDVYFGTDRDAVADADTSNTTGIYRGRQATTSYMPPEGVGWSTMPYYWRIDEVDSEGNKTTGDVWTFTKIPPPPPKGRACFLADTPVWVNGALVQISNVVSGQMVGEPHCDLATDCLEQIETVEEHEGTFECRDIVLESGNRISVVDAHCFMLDSGQWIAAQDLRSSLRLKTLSGTVGIKSVATRAAPFVGKVYNLKVTGVDRYLVSEDGVIVRDY